MKAFTKEVPKKAICYILLFCLVLQTPVLEVSSAYSKKDFGFLPSTFSTPLVIEELI